MTYESGEGLANRSCTTSLPAVQHHLVRAGIETRSSYTGEQAQLVPEQNCCWPRHDCSHAHVEGGSRPSSRHENSTARRLITVQSPSPSTVTSLSLQALLKSISKHRLKSKNGQNLLKGGAGAPELPISGGSKPLPRRKGSLILLLQPVSLLGITGEYGRGLGERKGRTTTCSLVLNFSS